MASGQRQSVLDQLQSQRSEVALTLNALDVAAENAYDAFRVTADLRDYLPMQVPSWAQLPEALKRAWRNAAAAARHAT
jgi:hypothetical protein